MTLGGIITILYHSLLPYFWLLLGLLSLPLLSFILARRYGPRLACRWILTGSLSSGVFMMLLVLALSSSNLSDILTWIDKIALSLVFIFGAIWGWSILRPWRRCA